MKKFILLTAALIGFINIKAQNPFAEYGYEPKIATLSQGQFIETFDNDTIVQIGSVLFNTKSKQIVAFVQTDTMYSEATLQPDIVSRWISPDPLAARFPSWSPYNYANGNPIYYIDPDGRAVKPVNEDAKLVINKSLGSFGVSSDKFSSMIGVYNSNGVMRSGLYSLASTHGMDMKEFKKHISPLLKEEGVTLSKEQLKSAHSLYKTFYTGNLYEVGVVLKPTGSATTLNPGDSQEGTRLVDGESNSTNANYNKFVYDFEQNPNAVDNVTKGNDYGIIPYSPTGDRDPSHKGTIIIDATGSNPNQGGEIFKKAANEIQDDK